MRYSKNKKHDSGMNVLGMLHIVDVRMFKKRTNEVTKQRILLVGCEAADIERKVRWIFDATEYDEFSITNVEKVREKMHILSTVITQRSENTGNQINRPDGTVPVNQMGTKIENNDSKLYAIGITTTMIAIDEKHALRKVARAILVSTSDVKSHSAGSLSDDSTIKVEQIPFGSGYARARDVSGEINPAHFVRG